MYSDNVYTIADLFFFTRLLGNTLSLSLPPFITASFLNKQNLSCHDTIDFAIFTTCMLPFLHLGYEKRISFASTCKVNK